MAHFAKIENDLVVQVIVAEQEFVDTLDGEWVQTSYNTKGNQHLLGNTPLRGNYAGVGFTYDRANDVFYQPKPHNSWTLSTTTWLWEPPLPWPTLAYNQIARWDEDAYQADNTTGWVIITEEVE